MTTVAFDLLGTLFDLEPLRSRLQEAGLQDGPLELWFAQSLRDYFAVSHSGAYVPLAAMLEASLVRMLRVRGLGEKEVIPDVMEAFSSLPPTRGAQDAVEALAAAGVRLLAVTNGSRSLAQSLLARAGFDRSFTSVLSCDDIGVSKPHPRVYERAKQLADADPWLVAAHAWDVAGAMRAGLKGAWVSSAEGVYPTMLQPPDVRADDVAEAARLILGAAAGPTEVTGGGGERPRR
jgi:2-haloacid dehalogenase